MEECEKTLKEILKHRREVLLARQCSLLFERSRLTDEIAELEEAMRAIGMEIPGERIKTGGAQWEAPSGPNAPASKGRKPYTRKGRKNGA